jgi:hypothetical protein
MEAFGATTIARAPRAHAARVFSAKGVLPLEFKPANSVGDLALQHLEALEQEAEEKGGVQQMLTEHFAKIYKASLPLAA